MYKCRLLATLFSFLSPLHYLQKWEVLHAERRIKNTLTRILSALLMVYLLKQVNSPATTQLARHEKYTRLQIIKPAIEDNFTFRMQSNLAASMDMFTLQLKVFLSGIASVLPANCMYFCLQKHVILQSSRGQNRMSSTCKITSGLPVILR